MAAQNLIVVAGPNGAGKSTFQATFLADKNLPFVNADVLAAELGLEGYDAAKMADDIRHRLLAEKKSFIFETVFSDPAGSKLDFLKRAVEEGYNVTLFFIGLESPALSSARVRTRVEAGGHDVPTEKLEPRYRRTLINLRNAIPAIPRVVMYDNSSYKNPYRFIAEFRNGTLHRRGEKPVPKWAREFVDE